MHIHEFTDILTSPLFESFVTQGLDRVEFITRYLTAHNVPCRTVTIQRQRHVIVRYSGASYNPLFRQKILAAHYDRTPGTPGANDNSAACMQLMIFAKQLTQYPSFHNITIIFTAGEEAGAGGITKQGAFSLGSGLRQLNLHKEDIFVFDLCGCGDTAIISQAGIFGRKKSLTKNIVNLHKRSCTYAQKSLPKNWFSLLTPYSDNAGFIAAGLTAQTITVLPANEARHLLDSISDHPLEKHSEQAKTAHNLEQLILQNKKPPRNSPFADVIPQTWQRMHTPDDTIATLTKSAFMLMSRFLTYLAQVKECAE